MISRNIAQKHMRTANTDSTFDSSATETSIAVIATNISEDRFLSLKTNHNTEKKLINSLSIALYFGFHIEFYRINTSLNRSYRKMKVDYFSETIIVRLVLNQTEEATRRTQI